MDIGEDLLGKKKYYVKMVGYFVYFELKVFIYILLGIFEDNKKFVNEFKGIINEFFEIKEMKSKVKDDFYKVVIYGKGNKKLN